MDELRFGLGYVRHTILLRLILGAAALNFTAGVALAAMPAYADALAVPSLLAGLQGAGSYGILMASFSTGTLLGALAANLVTDRSFGRTLAGGLAMASIFWTAAIALSWLPLTAVLFVLTFVPIGVININIATLAQSAPPEAVVGRVTSVFSSLTLATIPVGSLLGGAFASAFGSRVAMFAIGAGLAGMTAYVLSIPNLRNLPRIEDVTL